MLSRRLDLSSVSHAWNRDESKHNGRGWRRAWKTRLLLRAAVAAGYTDAPRNRANIGAAEFSPYIHHFSALWIKRRLVYSFEEVFFFFLLYALCKQLRLIYSSVMFYQFQHYFGLHTRLDWRSCAWLIMLNSNIISPVLTASSWNWGYQKVIKKKQRGGVYKVVETPGWECHQESVPFVMSQSVERLSEKRST